MQMTIEERILWKESNEREIKRAGGSPSIVEWYIFVFTDKRSLVEIHRVFLFPRMIEHLSRLPTIMRYKHLAATNINHEHRGIPRRRGLFLDQKCGDTSNIYWLWIEVKSRDPPNMRSFYSETSTGGLLHATSWFIIMITIDLDAYCNPNIYHIFPQIFRDLWIKSWRAFSNIDDATIEMPPTNRQYWNNYRNIKICIWSFALNLN